MLLKLMHFFSRFMLADVEEFLVDKSDFKVNSSK